MSPRSLYAVAMLALAVPAAGQSPHVDAIFPAGGRAGSTVEVELRGSGLLGASQLLVHGAGVTGTVASGSQKVDDTNKPVWQAKCAGCHELRSPANRSLSPGEWAATVARMVRAHNAPISPAEQAKITQYLVGMARSGKVTATVTVSGDALPGLREIRVVAPGGVSSPVYFDVGNAPETVAVACQLAAATEIAIPCVVNGCFTAQGEHHYMRFAAKQGMRIVFDMHAYRYNELSQLFFNPDLRLYDSAGKELAENHGYHELDPLIDWTCPADGEYVIEARDLLGRANPASVYRLEIGNIPYDRTLQPCAAQVGLSEGVNVLTHSGAGHSFTVPAPAGAGMTEVPTPDGPARMLVTPYTVVPAGGSAVSHLPACLYGVLSGDRADRFYVSGTGDYAFECYAGRLGSPAVPVVTIGDAAGHPIREIRGDALTYLGLAPGQTYTVTVANTALGSTGSPPNATYCVEVRPAPPDLAVTIWPDNVTVRPGAAGIVNARVVRRVGVEGDIVLAAEGLPAGVSMQPVVIPPDRDDAVIQLVAAAGTAPIAAPFRITATCQSKGRSAVVPAMPVEQMRFPNQAIRERAWADSVVAVCAAPDYTLELASPVIVHPREETHVTVKVHRAPGYAGTASVWLEGLPRGWYAAPVGVPAGQDTVQVVVRPDGQDPRPFLNRKTTMSPIRVTLEGGTDELRYGFGTADVRKSDHITEKDLNPQ